jgi:hypothetical protein
VPESGIYGEPSLSVSFNAPDGSKKRIILTFSGYAGEIERNHLKNEIENIIFHHRKSGTENNHIRKSGYSPEFSVNHGQPEPYKYSAANRQYPQNYQRDPFQVNTGNNSFESENYSRSCEIP